MAPFERWGPESSFEMMDSGAVALGRPRRAWDVRMRLKGKFRPRPMGRIADREVSHFPHRRAPFLRSVLIPSGLAGVDNELDPRGGTARLRMHGVPVNRSDQ